MSVPMSVSSENEAAPARVPQLEAGDHLSRDEFERRYERMPDLKKAELIEGEVYMPSPVRLRHHGQPHAFLMTILGNYHSDTPGLLIGDNTSVRLDLDNEPQPDVALMIDPSFGGKVQISTDEYVEGAPELVGEVASSSVSIDLHRKLKVYKRNQVQEYLVWRVLDREFDWFELRGSQYERLSPDSSGILRSKIFPGLWLDTTNLIKNDLRMARKVLDQGIASPEHAAFVAKLQQSLKGTP